MVSVELCLVTIAALGDLQSLLFTLAESCVDDRGKVMHDSFRVGILIGADTLGDDTVGSSTDVSFSMISSSSSCSLLAMKNGAQSRVLGLVCNGAGVVRGGT